MDAALTARLVAAARIGFGVALILTPARRGGGSLAPGPTPAACARDADATRGLGARDLALGAGALAVSDADLRPWVAAAVIADTGDLAATLAAGDSLPLAGRVLVGALASGGALLGAIALAGLRPKPVSAGIGSTRAPT